MKNIHYLGLISLFVLSSCVAPILNISKTTYVKNDFSLSATENECLAILPVVEGAGIEGYRRPFGDALNNAMETLGKGIRFIKWQDTLNILNENNLASRYQDALIRYKDTAIIDKNLIQDMGVALSAKYFLFVQLRPLENTHELRQSVLVRGVYTQETFGVSGFGQIWDAKEGDVVWEGVGGVMAQSDELSYIGDRNPETYSTKAAYALIKKILKLK